MAAWTDDDHRCDREESYALHVAGHDATGGYYDAWSLDSLIDEINMATRDSEALADELAALTRTVTALSVDRPLTSGASRADERPLTERAA